MLRSIHFIGAPKVTYFYFTSVKTHSCHIQISFVCIVFLEIRLSQRFIQELFDCNLFIIFLFFNYISNLTCSYFIFKITFKRFKLLNCFIIFLYIMQSLCVLKSNLVDSNMSLIKLFLNSFQTFHNIHNRIVI